MAGQHFVSFMKPQCIAKFKGTAENSLLSLFHRPIKKFPSGTESSRPSPNDQRRLVLPEEHNIQVLFMDTGVHFVYSEFCTFFFVKKKIINLILNEKECIFCCCYFYCCGSGICLDLGFTGALFVVCVSVVMYHKDI